MNIRLSVGVAAAMAVGVSVLSLSATAETKTWVGADSDWSEDANWSPAGAPAATDRVVFNGSASLTPPATFVGELLVTEGAFALTSDADLSFALAVKTGARFEKSGAGNVRVTAIPVLEAGFMTDGAISVKTGKMTFASAGQNRAPGFFGPLEVASGAEAAIADSPATGRHGGLVRALTTAYGNDIGPAQTVFNALANPLDVAALTAKWAESETDATLSGNGYWKFIAKDVDGVYPFSNRPKMLSALVDKRSFVTCTRGLVVAPGGKADIFYCLSWRAVPIVDGVRLAAVDNGNGIADERDLAAGWHAFDEVDCFWDGNASPDSRCIYHTDDGLQDGTMNEDALWYGVAFGGLTLADGAKLTVAADQAVAFAGAGATVAAGSVEAAEGAVFALMGGEWTMDMDCFENFAGTFELGKRATLAPGGVDLATFGGTLDWRGTVVAAAGLTGLQTRLTGALYIPEGVAVAADEALLAGVTVSGPGKVTVASEVSVAALGNCKAETELQDGGKIVSAFEDLLSRPKRVTLSGFDDPTAWWTTSNSVQAGTSHAGGRLANGKLTLVDAPGMQLAAAWLQNQKIGFDDKVDVSFSWQQSMCNYPEFDPTSSINSMAEGIAFLLQGMGLSLPGQDPPRTGCSGFELYGYTGMYFKWVVSGSNIDNVRLDGASNYGFVAGEPIAVRAGLTNGVISVTFSQENGATFSASRDLRIAFMAYEKLYLGFTAGTGTGRNYFRGDVWDFAGTVDTTESVSGDVVDATQSISTDNWTCWRGAEVVNGTQLLVQPAAAEATGPAAHAHAICQNPLSPYEPFSLDFDMIFEMNEGSGYWAEGWGFSFIDDPQSDNWDGGAPYVLRANNGMSFGDYTYQGHNFRTYTMINNAKTQLQGSDANPNGVNQTKSGEANPLHVKAIYDGAGTFVVTYSVAALNASYTQTQHFDNYNLMKDGKMYLAFSAGPGSGIHWVVTRADGLVLSRYSNNGTCPVSSPVSVAAGESAAVETASLAATATDGMALEDLTLGEGSTLSAAPPEGASGGWLGFGRVTSAPSATIAGAEGLVTAFDTIALTGTSAGPLAVTGAWSTRNGTLTFVIPSTWKDQFAFYAFKADMSQCRDAQAPTVVIVDEAGKVLRRAVTRKDDGYMISKYGLAIIVR